MSDDEVARGRHSETEEMLSVVIDPHGQLRARPAADTGTETYIGVLPAAVRDPALVGRWRHFKGGEYVFCASVAESPDGPLVLYLDASERVWLRPRRMIDEQVERDGRSVARFKRLDG